MNITNISADVRIVNYGSPFEFEFDIRVEERSKQGVWWIVWEANSLSNDLAYLEARERANCIARQRREQSSI